MAETRARDLANLAGAGATSTTVAYHETARAVTMPPGQGTDKQVISSTGGATTTWETIAVPPEVTSTTWYSDSGYSDVLTAAEAVNIDDVTYLKVTGTNLLDSSSFGSTAYVQIINQSSAVVGNNQSGVSGCVTVATHISSTEWRFTIAPASGSPSISAGDTLKVKAVTNGGTSLFATGYVVSADPTSVTTVNSSTVSNTASVGSYGGVNAGGDDDSNTKILLHFDRGGGTDIEDSSNTGEYGQRVALSGGPSIKASPFGDGKSAMYFDGSDDQLLIPNHEDFNVNADPWSLDFWWLTTDKTDDGAIVGLGDVNDIDTSPSDAERAFDIYMNTSGVIYWFASDGTPWNLNETSTGFTMTNNTWVHVAVTYGGTSDKNYRIYFDGSLYQTVSTTDVLPTSTNNQGLVIGVSTSGSHTKGYVDEIRWVKGENPFPASGFTPSKYRYDNTGDVTGPNGSTHNTDTAGNTKLLIHSNLDTTSGTTFDDSSASDHNITRTGAIHTTAHGGIAPAMTWPASNKTYGSSGCYFDGDGDYLSTTLSTAIGVTPFTLDFWVYYQEGDDSLSFLCDTRAGNDNGFYLLLTKSTGLISFGMQDATDAATTTALPLNTWTHLAFERSSTYTTCYFNGARQGHTSNSASGSNLSNPAFRLGIGSALSGNEFKGYMDEVRLSYTARYGGASSFTVPSTIYGGVKGTTIDNITLTGTPGTGGGKVIYNTATLSGQTETTYALPAGLSISPTVNTTSTTNVATISGDLTADVGTHSIKIVARASSDGSSANIDPNRKQDYTHSITKNSGGDPVLFNGRRYIGDATAASSGGNQISGFGFRPDLVIGKRRNGTQGWSICDSIRGVKTVQPITDAVAYTDGESVLSFDVDGVTFGNTAEFNGSDHQQMLWGFKAGGVPSGDGKRINDGDSDNEVSLTTSSGQAKGASVYGRTGGTSDISAVRQSVNTAGGFSITKWTSTNTGNTNHVPHGFLTTPPEFLMIKAYIAPTNDTDPDWIVWHKSLTTTYSKRLILNTTSAEAGTDAWGSSSDSPDNTSVSLGASQYNNYNNGSYIMYAWTRKAGVSSFGKYTGSGSTKTVYFNTTGDGNTNANVDSFTPRFIIIKNMDSTSNWVFYDQMRGFGTSNAFDARYLSPDTVGSEDVAYGGLTVTTGGWTMEIVSGDTAQILTDLNTSGDNYIYAAFA